MMKALKSKLAIGVIATGLVAGMGTAFAATDAGGQLQSWYSSATKATKALVAGDVYGYVESNKAKLVSDYNTINNTAVNDVKTAGTTETARVQGSINGQVTTYSNAIDSKNASIKGNMPGEYNNVVNEANNFNNGVVWGLGEAGKFDIKKDVNAQGTSSVKSLETAVGTTQTQAATTLTKKIEDTKAELNTLLAAERTAASQEIKDNLAAKIAAKLAELQTLADTLETANKKAITDKGASLETTGLAALESIVINGLK
ncbi:hypothetical protein [Paenibacillus sp. Soil724D2]|uniref:hypothetical protein n=1 Tax=Paenibacillus sp. (strain Soil724D2) TaxID=1736392 RepID=UPI0007127FC1|nr:hypothetical protein [Paenibacillus sp. Soil724D2]KRE49179.1 hypothetical protein ASG85_24960 [Paenibacillus sp. Soil724D2]